MYTVDEKGNKKPVRETYIPQRNVRENYGSGTCPKWVMWVLLSLAVVAIVMLVMWALKPNKSAAMAQQRWGFRFY